MVVVSNSDTWSDCTFSAFLQAIVVPVVVVAAVAATQAATIQLVGIPATTMVGSSSNNNSHMEPQASLFTSLLLVILCMKVTMLCCDHPAQYAAYGGQYGGHAGQYGAAAQGYVGYGGHQATTANPEARTDYSSGFSYGGAGL